MAGEFGAYINKKRKGRGPGGSDILLRDLAEAMGNMSVSYLSDIIKGRRNPPDKKLLDGIFIPQETPARCSGDGCVHPSPPV